MGFKRTSEGRVFFQGADSNANDENPSAKPGHSFSANTMPVHSPHVQAQIVTLLKTLNERLKTTQNDRERIAKELEAYRNLVEDLEKKTERSERAYLELERKIAKEISQKATEGTAEILAQEALNEIKTTRQMLLEIEDKALRADQNVSSLRAELTEARKTETHLISKQTALEKITKEQSEKFAQGAETYAELLRRIKESEQKHDDLNNKIEQTTLEQARLIRKVDKAIEDRARFMRKIERIEETVIQTRDSLNAKAMVLLTDQGLTGQSEYNEVLDQELATLQAQSSALHEGLEATTPIQGRIAQKSKKSSWDALGQWQTMGLVVAVMASLLAGWVISEMQKPGFERLGAQKWFEPKADSLSVSHALPGKIENSTVPENKDDISATDTFDASPSPQSVLSQKPENPPLNMLDTDWNIQTETETETALETHKNLSAAQDDIGTLDLNTQEDVEKFLESDMNTIAQQLNTLEPSKPVANLAKGQNAQTLTLSPETVTLRNPVELIKPDTNLPASVKQIEHQAFVGVPEAQHDLAAIYTAGHGGVRQDYKRAAFWFEQSSDRGIANGAYNLGVLHHQGLGVKANIHTAITWYARAASLGHPEAQYNLGIAYIEGIGVAYDPIKAADYFRKAADQNIMEAAYNLGLIYENGLLGDTKPDEALAWYKIAADQGSPEAKQALEQLAKSLDLKLEDIKTIAEDVKVLNQTEISPPVNKKSKSQTSAQSLSSSERSLVAQIQEYLLKTGLFPGPADGTTGPLTEDAIRTYQRNNGLNPDGRATQSLLTHMLVNSNYVQTGDQQNIQ